MKLKIKFLKPFSKIIGKNELKLDFNGITFEDLLNVLVDKYPKLKNEFYTKTGELSDYIGIFVNDKPISALNGVKTEFKNGDELIFFFPISGG
ncbi:MAG: MoaD family protein [Candidatus Thermoplasmatota archaeon]|jgi:MoaD family protein